MNMTLYNSLTRQKEEFTPASDTVLLYTCGPTVYNYLHIGNLRTYIFEDLLKRTLLANDMTVNHVMNITDVGHLVGDGDTGDDKLEKAASDGGANVWELAKKYTDAFQSDFARLNVLPPNTYTKATDYIKQQIALVNTLEEKGHTYTTEDGVYFDTATFPAYGALLSKEHLDGLQEGARVDSGDKRNPTDFALWKFSPEDAQRQMEWESPWGVGFPGWHAECSAMAMAELGNTIDIHCGGIDHIPVHHTNEIAQSEAATGELFSRFWCHGEFLVIDNARMGKSMGNFLTLQSLIDKGYSPAVYRYFLLQTHYRKQLNFSWDAMDAAKAGLTNLVARLQKVEAGVVNDELLSEIRDALNDDLNAPQALALVWKAIGKSGDVSPDVVATILAADNWMLGLNLEELITLPSITDDAPDEIQALAQKRKVARENKDWEAADALRNQINDAGWNVLDGPDGHTLNKL